MKLNVNTNYHTIIQMPHIVNDLVRQATGRDPVQNVDMDFATVAQNKVPYITEFSGESMIHFVSDGAAVLSALSVAIEPVQAGSGEPSQENVRPISGWNAVKIFVSPTSEAADGETYTIAFPGEIGTVYGGTLDVITGVLTVDRQIITLNGSENWTMFVTSKFFAPVLNENTAAIQRTGYISNQYVFYGSGNSTSNGITIDKRFYGQTALGRFWVYDSSYDSVDAFKEALASNPLTIVYPLAVPVTYQITPQEIPLLLGENNIWSDAGAVSATVTKYETFSEVLPL